MIGFLSGKNKFISEKYVILDVNGVGYKVFLSSSTIFELQNKDHTNLWIHTVVKENDISLYGFLDKSSHDFFEILIGVSGIGPKSALEILNLPVSTIKSAIISGDTESLKQVKGIGQKVAERIIVELKNKIGKSITIDSISNKDNSEHDIMSEAILALESLGFLRNEIIKKIRNAPSFDSSEDLVKWYLSSST